MKRALSSKKSGIPSQSLLKKLPREFYNVPALELSQALIGKVLARKLPDGEVLRGTIVETEAYPGKIDQASRTYHQKQTEKNGALFMDPGTAYVYFTMGMYHCFNISSQEEGGAILLRAIEPFEDYEAMHRLRTLPSKKKKPNNVPAKKKPPLKLYELANGPGKLCLAFDVHRHTCDKLDLTSSDLMWIEEENPSPSFQPRKFLIEPAKRVGIDSAPSKARDQLWRFLVTDNLAVSTAKPNQIIKKLAQLQAAAAEEEDDGSDSDTEA